jgi:hypothetical protein
MTAMGDWHLGQVKTGLGRGVATSMTTFKTNRTRDNSFLALVCKKAIISEATNAFGQDVFLEELKAVTIDLDGAPGMGLEQAGE